MVFLALFLAGCTLPGAGGNNAPMCGNKIIEGNEQCEIGIACKNASLVCNKDCRCVPPTPQNNIVSCAGNAKNVTGGSINSFNPSAMKCQDDCKAFDPKSVCDATTCTCTRSCANVTIGALANGTNLSNQNINLTAGPLVCKDDCARLGAAFSCDAATCLCKKKVPQPLNCGTNTLFNSLTGGNLFNPASMICVNDCVAALKDPRAVCSANCLCSIPQVSCNANTNAVNMGLANGFNPAVNQCKPDCPAGLVCDAKCTCQKPPPPSCIGNTLNVVFGGKNEFNPLGGVACKDDCKTFDKDLVCDPVKCICDYPPNKPNDTLPCATNTIFEKDGGGSIYDPKVYKCEDNCKELDPNLACDAKTCLCVKPVTENLTGTSCAQNTVPGSVDTYAKFMGRLCRDDCNATFGSAYTCNPIACQCIKNPPTEVSCSQNTGTAPYYTSSFFDVFVNVNSFTPGANICKDDCPSEGWKCDATTCRCVPKTPPTGVSCVQNTKDVAATGFTKNNFNPSANRCEDDCAKIFTTTVECDPVGCYCKPKTTVNDTQTSCAVNSYDTSYGGQNLYGPGKSQCVDDCSQLGSQWKCDGTQCRCFVPQTISCQQNSWDSTHTGIHTGATSIGAGNICKNDCNAGMQCDPTLCVCKPAVTVGDNQTSCAVNTYDSSYTHSNFVPGATQCKDDCDVLSKKFGTTFTCDSTCRCKEVQQKNVSCADNTNTDSPSTVERAGAGIMCQDDCKRLGSGYGCDAASCTCVKIHKIESCAANSKYSSDTGGQSMIDTAAGDICLDDCKSIAGEGSTCDSATCTCKPPAISTEPVSCAVNTLDVHSGKNGSFSAGMQCKDDCEQNWGPGSKCDEKCTCSEPQTPPREVTCAGNSLSTTVSANGAVVGGSFNPSSQICIDNCQSLDSDLSCDSKTCTCKPKVIPKQLYCGDNTLATGFGQNNTYVPGVTQCKDNCPDFGDFLGVPLECDATTCTCKESKTLSCTSNSFYFGESGGYLGGSGSLTAQSAMKPGMMCQDDCAKFSPGMTCDPTKCVCIQPDHVLSCSDRTQQAGATTVEKVPYGYICKNDCPQGQTCDENCICKSSTTNVQVSCASRNGTTVEALPPGAQCKPDCPEGYTCDASCTCQKVPSTTQQEISCANNVIAPTAGGEATQPQTFANLHPGAICKDDCSTKGTGYYCDKTACTCKKSQCGDGVVTAPEECDPGNSFTAQCPNGNLCVNCRCSTPTGTTGSHLECQNNACVSVAGTGSNQCSSDQDCAPSTTASHTVCRNSACVSVSGSGSNQCSTDADCGGGTTGGGTTIYYYSQCDFAHGVCEKLNSTTPQSGNCNKDSDCVPPVVDCGSYCSAHGYSMNLGSGYSTQSQCVQANPDSQPPVCTWQCSYYKFYEASNQAGTTTCCCKAYATGSCTSTPTGCSCPSQTEMSSSICPANSPKPG